MDETIATAALKIGDLVLTVDRPGRHHTIFRKMTDVGIKPLAHQPHEQGFLTSYGRFVSRHTATLVAKNAGQLIRGDKEVGEELFSEDVW